MLYIQMPFSVRRGLHLKAAVFLKGRLEAVVSLHRKYHDGTEPPADGGSKDFLAAIAALTSVVPCSRLLALDRSWSRPLRVTLARPLLPSLQRASSSSLSVTGIPQQ